MADKTSPRCSYLTQRIELDEAETEVAQWSPGLERSKIFPAVSQNKLGNKKILQTGYATFNIFLRFTHTVINFITINYKHIVVFKLQYMMKN